MRSSKSTAGISCHIDVNVGSNVESWKLRFYATGFLSSGSNYFDLLRSAEKWILAEGRVKVIYGQPLDFRLVGSSPVHIPDLIFVAPIDGTIPVWLPEILYIGSLSLNFF